MCQMRLSAAWSYFARSTFAAAACCTAMASAVGAEDAETQRVARVEQTQFLQIPGPNPIITPGPDGAWDDRVVEASDAFWDADKYYFYYHACGAGKGYRLGVASSTHPLGPFKKCGHKPVLDLGPKGSWDDTHVACAMVVRAEDERENTYTLWYSGCGSDTMWSIGLATAESPLGPWKKYEGNPVLKDFGYLGGVIKIDGKYRLYSAHPIRMPWARWEEGKQRSLGYHSDYSPLAVAIGEKPEGPFEKYHGNPLLERGNPGDWDDGGISEAEVLCNNGMFHMFYGGTRSYGPRTESIGYAYSFDGLKWRKFGRNPVASRHAETNAAAFAEVHAIFQSPFIYLYHTERPKNAGGRDHPWIEDLGVQVLVTQRPFSLDMPVLRLDRLPAGATTTLIKCPPVALGHVTRAALTVEATCTEQSVARLLLHVRSSPDGVTYDTADLQTFGVDLQPGPTCRQTFPLSTDVRFIKVLVENADRSEDLVDVQVTATLGG